VRRVYTNADGKTLEVFNQEIGITGVERLDGLPAGLDQIVLYGYPRTLRRLYYEAPDVLIEKLGSLSALIDMAQFRAYIQQKK
jgi:hypothetical protein